MNTETHKKGCVHCTEMRLNRCPDAFSEVAQYCGNYDHRPVVPIEAPTPDRSSGGPEPTGGTP